MSWGPLGWAGGKVADGWGSVHHFVGKGGPLDHAVIGGGKAALGAAGHGLGWAWGQGVEHFARPWATSLGYGGKLLGTVDPRAGAVVGGAGKLFGGLGPGAKALGGLGWKGLAIAGAGFLALGALVGRLFASRPRIRFGGPRHARGRGGGAVYVPVSGGTVKTVAIVVLLLLLFGLTTPAQMWAGASGLGGFTIGGSSYGCPSTVPSGIEGAAYRAGHGLRTVALAEPDPQELLDSLVGIARKAGSAWKLFQLSLNGDPGALPTPPPALTPQQQVAMTGCCTQTPGPMPAGWTTSDSPGVVSAKAALAAGVPAAQLAVATAIAYAESGNSDTATHLNSNGTTDYGRWQINSVHADLLARHDWRSPAGNAAMMLELSHGGTDWSAWSTYKSGAWRAFLPQATQDARAATGFIGPLAIAEPAAADPVVPASQCAPASYTGGQVPPGTGSAEQAIAYAYAQLNDPYEWTAAGPDSWDCSGLVDVAYGLSPVGHHGPATATLIGMGTRITPGREIRGDLVFPEPGHVGIALGDGTYIEAPHTGDVVKIAPYGRPWAVVRLPQSTGLAA